MSHKRVCAIAAELSARASSSPSHRPRRIMNAPPKQVGGESRRLLFEFALRKRMESDRSHAAAERTAASSGLGMRNRAGHRLASQALSFRIAVVCARQDWRVVERGFQYGLNEARRECGISRASDCNLWSRLCATLWCGRLNSTGSHKYNCIQVAAGWIPRSRRCELDSDLRNSPACAWRKPMSATLASPLDSSPFPRQSLAAVRGEAYSRHGIRCCC